MQSCRQSTPDTPQVKAVRQCLSCSFDEDAARLLAVFQQRKVVVPPSAACVEERIVSLPPVARRKKALNLCNVAPASLQDVGDARALEMYTLDALRKLARQAGLKTDKAMCRESVIGRLEECIRENLLKENPVAPTS